MCRTLVLLISQPGLNTNTFWSEQVLLGLLFLCLVALEKNNKCTVKLVKKLAFVSIEVSRGVELESSERAYHTRFTWQYF